MDKKLREKILSKIKPTLLEHELMEKSVKSFVSRLRRAAKKLEITCSFFVGGSFGKGTYLKEKSDVDIFARFDLIYDDNKLSSYLENILSEAKYKYKKQKGSRDYFSIPIKSNGHKIIFEVVPNRKIENISQMLNSTDVSPMHVDFLKHKVKENSNLTDEIRLAKQFFKSCGLYGAESYINGFSGHSIDILIAFYGTLENLILAAKNWDEQTFIDISSFYNNFNEALDTMDEDKISNLILVDPIIKERNASRALSNQKYGEFLLLANNFNDFKNEDFEVNSINILAISDEIKEFAKQNNLKVLLYKIKFDVKNDSEDIVGSKLLKLSKKLEKYFSDYDFKLFLSNFFINIKSGEVLFAYLFEKVDLPNVKKVYGPKVFMKDAIDNFLKNRKDYFIEDSRVCVYEKRVLVKLTEISNLKFDDMQKLLGKDISFVKSITRFLK